MVLAGILFGGCYVFWACVYRVARKLAVERHQPDAGHLLGAADELGDYGDGVLDEDSPVLANLDGLDLQKLRDEHMWADVFSPFKEGLSTSYHHRCLLRYWVDRALMEVKIVRDTPADRAVLRHIVIKMMRAKHYRTHMIAAMVDTVVGLAVVGTKAQQYSTLVSESAGKETWLQWFFGATASERRNMLR
jgi:hypothetical protein